MTPQTAELFYRLAYWQIRGDEPSAKELNDWMAKPLDDASVRVNIVNILDSPEGVAYKAKMAAIVAAGPAQPPVAQPPAPVGASANHKHRNDGVDPGSALTSEPVG